MTKIKPTTEVAKDGYRHPKSGSIHKKKQQKFKNTPTGKVALIDTKKAQQKSNGKPAHQNGNQKHQNSPKQNQSPKGSNRHSNSPKNLNANKSPKIKIEEEQDDDDSSVDDINEGISIKEDISAPEDEVDDDSSSSETEAVPDIFGQSLADETDEDDDEFDADTDEGEEDAAENKGVKMFKGVQPKVEQKESSDDDEDDDDDDSSDEDAEPAPGLKDLLGASIADESDDEDFKSGEESDDDEDSDEEVDQSLNSSNVSTTDEDDDEEDDDDDDEEEEDSSDDEAAPDLTALLGNSIAEDSDDEDFEGDENDEDDEDEDMSDDDEDEDTPSPKKKVKVVNAEDAEEEEDGDDDDKNESFDSTNDKSDADDSEKPPKMTAEEKEERDRRTIFIGNVPKETKVSRIKTLFKKFGTIDSIRIRGIIPENPKMPLKVAAIKKKFHSKSKTICVFVTFESVESVEKALSMNGKKLDGNFLRVDRANQSRPRDKNRTVFLGNLPFTVEDNEVWETFKNCGRIESVRIIRDRRTGVGRGFGYINFETADGAVLAMNLNGTTIKNRELRVQVNTPEGKKKQRAEKKGKKRRLIEGTEGESPKKQKTGSETARVARHNSVNAERRTDKKKRSQGEKQRGSSQSSPEGKGAGKFQGQKADNKKKSKPNKHAKKKMQMAAKLLAKPKKPSAN